MTTSLEATEKDFGQMMEFIMGYFQTQTGIGVPPIANHFTVSCA